MSKISEEMKEQIKSWLIFLKKNKRAALSTFWLIILGDIVFSEIQSDLLVFGILGLYIFVIFLFKLRSKSTFFSCFFILGTLFIEFVFTSTSIHTEKAAVWLFLFVAIGIIQELLGKR